MKMRYFFVAFLLLLPLVGLAEQAPSIQRGFAADKVYDFSEVDTVNTFNGNLAIQIPLGTSYPVGGQVGYSLALSYNSKVWDYEDYAGGVRAVPARRSNAGVGWLLSMGRIIPINDSSNDSSVVIYESPDGADHEFRPTMNPDDTSTTAGVGYTIDGTYLRLTEKSDGTSVVESPDGGRRIFESTYGHLLSIRDRWENHIAIAYKLSPVGTPCLANSTLVWEITDSANARTNYVCFEDAPDAYYANRIERVVLAAPANVPGGASIYRFVYDTDNSVGRGCNSMLQDPDLPPDPKLSGTIANLPILRRLILPDGSDYEFRYNYGNTNGACETGTLAGLTLPTGASIDYTYRSYTIPVDAGNGCAASASWRSNVVGVATRTVTGANMQTEAWEYSSTPSNSPGQSFCTYGENNAPSLRPSAPEELTVSVKDPHNNVTRHYYSVWPFEFDASGNVALISPNGFRKSEYGEPFTRRVASGGGFLSQQMLDGAGNVLRSVYIGREQDAWPCTGLYDPCWNGNRRTKYERTVENTGEWKEVTYSDFDGLGHYRVRETAGFGVESKRRTTTNFNPNVASGPDVVPPPSSPWLLNLFTYEETKEISQSGAVLASAKAEVCFDNNGFLKRRRTIAGGAISPTRDLLAVFEPNARGEVAAEAYYGGDGVPLPSGFDSCNSAVSAPQYRVTHDYVSGVKTRSRYDGTTFDSYDVERYPSTSAISISRDTAGVPTTYVYDGLGRVIEIHPQGSAWTEYEFTVPATSSAAASVAVRQRPEGTSKSTPAIVEARYYFDGMGRLIQTKSAMPNDQWATVNRSYDPLGRLFRESVPYVATSPDLDLTLPPSTYTELSYDSLGRTTGIKTPDGKQTTTTYIGATEQLRTSSVATGFNQETAESTRSIYDYLGRLTTVKENDDTVVARYTYDIGNRLSYVQLSGPDGSQTRTFDYDGRGFLRWESHPEAGMTSYTYDARGHVLTRTQSAAMSLFDLTYQYDAAERPVEVRGRNPFFNPASPNDPDQPAFRLLKQFTYGQENETDNNILGKLRTASRYNYDPSSGAGDTYKVRETYRYGDAAGRLNHRITSITHGVGTNESMWESDRDIVTEIEHNDLNLPEIVKYPSCLDCGVSSGPGPVRHQGYVYAEGRLTSVPGFVDSVTYWPNGLWNTMGRSNGMTDTQAVDPSGMARPQSFSAALSDSCTRATVTNDPVGGTITPSTPLTLSVTVTGTAPFTYEWWDSGSMVASSGPTSSPTSTFTATTANTPTTTRYRVFVRNACGQVVSVFATVSVGECLGPSVGASSQPNGDGTYTLSAVAQGSEPRTYTWRRTSDQAWIGSTRTVAVGPLSATTTYTVSVGNDCTGTPATDDVTIEIPTPMAAVVTATRTPNANQVHVTWTGPTTGVAYTLQRRSGAGGWADLVVLSAANLSARAYDDGAAVLAGRTYAYRLRNGNGQYSNVDVATTTTFTPAAVGSGATVSALDPALAAVNSVRAALGWPAVTWANILSSKDPLPAQGAPIMSTHIMSARARMNEALQALGVVTGAYTPGDVKGAVIKAEHINAIMERAY